MERVWGGTKLAPYLETALNATGPVGEAWLISDHSSAESVVDIGPQAGQTLRSLLEADADRILGTLAKLTPHGRFPLLLKILDAGAPLSVQVHPDDACAARLGEPDVGKTEMWHIIESDPGSELVCGLDPNMDAAAFQAAIERGGIEEAMARFAAGPGDSVFVPAGTVHAIGAGILLAEIQQNSDLTYRIYDYKRTGPDGKERELHVEKSIEAVRFGSPHAGKNESLEIPFDRGRRSILAACEYFAAERIEFEGAFQRDTQYASFHIVLMIEGAGRIAAGGRAVDLARGQAALIAAETGPYDVQGSGAALVYYTPDLRRDIVAPLLKAGHGAEAIARLGGDPAISTLARLL